jgi:hypothetical protein
MKENSQKPLNQRFIKLSLYLKDIKKITFESQSDVLGVSYQKVRNIHRGVSSADRYMVAKMEMAYRNELADFEGAQKLTTFAEENEKLEAENAKLRQTFEIMIIERQAALERKFDDLDKRLNELEKK